MLVDVRHRQGSLLLRAEGGGRDQRELGGRHAEHHLGEQALEARLQRHRARVPAEGALLQFGEQGGDLLVGAVLQQPREQQVTRLQQRQVVLVLDVTGRQQPGGLQVQQGRRDDQELGGLVEVPRLAHAADVRDEVVGDPVQRHLGHVQCVLRDQLQQEVERTLEVREPDLELAIIRNSNFSRSVLGHCSRNLRTSSDASPCVSRSSSTIAIASRTTRPRSTPSE